MSELTPNSNKPSKENPNETPNEEVNNPVVEGSSKAPNEKVSDPVVDGTSESPNEKESEPVEEKKMDAPDEKVSEPDKEGTADTSIDHTNQSDPLKNSGSAASGGNVVDGQERISEGGRQLKKDNGENEQETPLGSGTSDSTMHSELLPNATASDLRAIMTNEIENIKAMTVAEFLATMPAMEKLHNEIYVIVERLITELLKKIPDISPTLKQVGEYDQFAFDKLIATTLENFTNIGKTAEDREKLLATIEERLAEAVKVNFDFTHQISFVASPLTVWRLDACRAVWEGHNEIVNAMKSDKILLVDPNAPKDGDAEKEDEKKEGEGAESEKEDDANAQDGAIEESKVDEHVEGELDPEEIAKSERPPLKAWPKRIYTSGEGAAQQVVCYVRAPPDCLVNDDDLICTFGNSLAQWPNLPGNSEVIGKFVCIKPRHPKVICILPSEPWIIGIPHSFGKTSTKEVVIFAMDGSETGLPQLVEEDEKPPATITDVPDPATEQTAEADTSAKPATETPKLEKIPWTDLQTADVTGEDSRYLEVRITKLTEVVLAPAARIRRDTAELGRNGGKLTSLVDNRVVLIVPPSALKISLVYCMQVQSINQHHAQLIRDQNLSFMSSFIACSPLVIITGTKKIVFKPATMSLPLTDLNPTSQVVIMSTSAMPETFSSNKTGNESEDATGSEDEMKVKKTNVVTLDPFQRSLLLPKLLAGATSSHAEMALMISGPEDSHWIPWTSPEITETKNSDMCVFNFVRLQPCKFMAIKTRTVADPESLLQMATVLERSLSQRMVYFILRQDKVDSSRICLAVSLHANMDKTMQILDSEGFTEGDKPTGPLFIHERQVFDISFKGNIRPKKGGQRDSVHLAPGYGPMRISFNSSLRNRYIVEVEECDPSAQVACEKFRGFLEVSYQHMVQKAVKKNKMGRTSVRAPNKKFVMELETVLLCQLLIKLPKHGADQPTLAEMQAFTFIPKDIISDAYLVALSKKLVGDNWRRLGSALKLTRTQLQAVGGRAESAGVNKALTMLNTWVKNLPLEVDRCGMLQNAFIAIGRNDLANELRTDSTAMATAGHQEENKTPPIAVPEPTAAEVS